MTIVELHPGHHASEDFRTIAGELGFDFRRLPCSVTTPSLELGSDIVVDVGALLRLIDDVP